MAVSNDRSFSLPSLLGIVALFAVSLGLVRLGFPPDTIWQRMSIVVGSLWLTAGLGATIGFLLGGQRGVVLGAVFTILAALLLSCAVGLFAVTH